MYLGVANIIDYSIFNPPQWAKDSWGDAVYRGYPAWLKMPLFTPNRSWRGIPVKAQSDGTQYVVSPFADVTPDNLGPTSWDESWDDYFYDSATGHWKIYPTTALDSGKGGTVGDVVYGDPIGADSLEPRLNTDTASVSGVQNKAGVDVASSGGVANLLVDAGGIPPARGGPYNVQARVGPLAAETGVPSSTMLWIGAAAIILFYLAKK